MVRVCDAIMGTGKSSAAITYMNEHSDQKFIYITPYLTEAARIKKACPSLHFVEPRCDIAKYEFKKSLHTVALIEDGRNITTTHQAFKGYTPRTLDLIREKEYTLIIDENVNVLEEFEFDVGDLQIALDAGYVKAGNFSYTLQDDKYDGDALAEMFRLFRSRDLIRAEESDNKLLFYWALPVDLITSFKDVFILTYLFDGQSLHHFLKVHNIPYTHISVELRGEGEFRFCDGDGYVPEYVKDLPNKIHILDNPRMNSIGDNTHALSMNWFKMNRGGGVQQLKRNVSNYFNNIWRSVPAANRLWGAFSESKTSIGGKGYTKAFLSFNQRASNEYRDRYCLAYLVNLFMNVNERMYYASNGVDVDEDIYALSIMVQWIWRSAIRDGKDVQLYIPSKRMRALLTDWMDTTSKGGNLIVH